jgi:hypothetical protein
LSVKLPASALEVRRSQYDHQNQRKIISHAHAI